jgi:hypothetical protein
MCRSAIVSIRVGSSNGKPHIRAGAPEEAGLAWPKADSKSRSPLKNGSSPRSRTGSASVAGGVLSPQEVAKLTRINEFQESSYITPLTRGPTSIGSCHRKLPQEPLESYGAVPSTNTASPHTQRLPATLPARSTPHVPYADPPPVSTLLLSSLEPGVSSVRPHSAPQDRKRLVVSAPMSPRMSVAPYTPGSAGNSYVDAGSRPRRAAVPRPSPGRCVGFVGHAQLCVVAYGCQYEGMRWHIVLLNVLVAKCALAHGCVPALDEPALMSFLGLHLANLRLTYPPRWRGY